MERLHNTDEVDALLRQLRCAAGDSAAREQIAVAASQLAIAVQDLLRERDQLIDERDRLLEERNSMAGRLTRGPRRPPMTAVNIPGLS